MTALFQAIRQRFQLGHATHMTHVENLPAILAAGGLRSYNAMRGHAYMNLANEDVQAGRAAIVVPSVQRPLHDFVPLYFGFKTPMVAWNQNRNEQIIFLRVSLEILAATGVVFTDGNARAGTTRFFNFTGPDDLAALNARAINTTKYAGDPELKRQKQAEVLVPDFLPFDKVLDIICYSAVARDKVLDALAKSAIKRQALVNRGWYFVSHPTP